MFARKFLDPEQLRLRLQLCAISWERYAALAAQRSSPKLSWCTTGFDSVLAQCVESDICGSSRNANRKTYPCPFSLEALMWSRPMVGFRDACRWRQEIYSCRATQPSCRDSGVTSPPALLPTGLPGIGMMLRLDILGLQQRRSNFFTNNIDY